MYADEVSMKQVRFGGSLGRITGKPRLAPIKRTPREERGDAYKPMLTPTPVSTPRSRATEDTPSSEDEGYRTARSCGGEDLLLDDLKEKLRPVIDHRMPTLVTKRGMFATSGPASASLQQVPAISKRRKEFVTKSTGGNSFLASPLRNMHFLRESIFQEIKLITRALTALEREYYGERANVNGEVERYAHSVRMLMKALMIFDLNNAPAIDDLIRIATNTNRYKGEPKYIADIKEVHAKVQTFLPDKVMALVEKCQTLLDAVVKYCVSFYVPGTDHYLETADHYSEQIAAWKEKAGESVGSARSLYSRFKTSGITLSMLSNPVEAFGTANRLQRMLFLVIFADSCTHMRNALEVMKTWVKTDTNYVTFVKNDLSRLENLREDKVQQLRILREQFHSLTFKLTHLEAEYAKRAVEANTLREKEGDMRIEEVYLVNSLTSLKREIEKKERKCEQLQRLNGSYPHGFGQGHTPMPTPEPSIDSVESLRGDIQDAKDQLPTVVRHLGVVRQKLDWIAKSMATLDRICTDIQATKKELKQVAAERERKEAEFAEIGLAVDVAKRIFMCKNASDAVEKLHYSICMESRASRMIKPLQECRIQDPLDKACKITALRILGDWPSLYSNLPFYPPRGSQTVAQDIVELTESGGRCSHTFKARRALDRWRRHHTRANAEDLRRTLKRIRRSDVVQHIDAQAKSSSGPAAPSVAQAPFEREEEKPPDVEPHLIPFFKQVEKYDQIVATRKLEGLTKARRRAAHRRLQEQ